MPGRGHAERAVQASRRQEYWAQLPVLLIQSASLYPLVGEHNYDRNRHVVHKTANIAARTRDRSALASREKCPCFQFARLLRSRPSGVRGPVLLPP